MKYAEQFADWLVDEGYTHCFFVAGGNIMHLLNAVRTRMTCVPVVHEVAAGIAAEYFNEVSGTEDRRAFALVTAGPGVTNIVTAVAGAFAESRELLVVGGQVKSSDLAGPNLRQRGIQEVDGIAVMQPLCKSVLRVASPLPSAVVIEAVRSGTSGRPGPVYVEFCLDVQAAGAVRDAGGVSSAAVWSAGRPLPHMPAIADRLSVSRRPVLLIGGGVGRVVARQWSALLGESRLPVMTTWNGADRVSSELETYWGRPNTWGMRYSNILLQQSDLVIALGTRLGLQQTGFNWEAFAPVGEVIQIDVDQAELDKGHPRVDLAVRGDADDYLPVVLEVAKTCSSSWEEWRGFGAEVRALIPTVDPSNDTQPGYLDPFEFGALLAERSTPTDIIIPSSSGGAYTSIMQTFRQFGDQIMLSDKGMASMGYGLPGAIGAAIADKSRRVLHMEGDGGLAQNLQEFGTVRAQALNIKTFVYSNEGYASIRMTQRNYFDGAYVGCDVSTGLGLPDWHLLCDAYGIPCIEVSADDPFGVDVVDALEAPGPSIFIVPIDPGQSYFPKITSRVTSSGGMESNPLHLMSPALESSVEERVMKYLPESLRSQV